jgi:hypothetical protein
MAQPRAATVTAVTQCVCLVMDKGNFIRLLEPLRETLSERFSVYEEFEREHTAPRAEATPSKNTRGKA